MRLRQIETFYWAARLGSLINAARKLNATQSAVSMRIHELESRLGVRLFDRSQRAVRLTPDGLNLLPYAEQIVHTTEQMMAAAAKRDMISGYVRIGVAEIIAHTWLPRFFELLRASYPNVRVELEVGLSHVLETKMLDGSLDMALTAFELPSSRCISIDLGHVLFCWMAGAGMPDIPETVDAEELSGLPVILTSREEQHRGATLDWLIDQQVRFRALTICNTFTTAASMAKAGLGIALLPLELYHKDVEEGALRIVACRPEISPLKLFSLRPRLNETPAHRAVEWTAATASTFPGKVVPPKP